MKFPRIASTTEKSCPHCCDVRKTSTPTASHVYRFAANQFLRIIDGPLVGPTLHAVRLLGYGSAADDARGARSGLRHLWMREVRVCLASRIAAMDAGGLSRRALS